MGPGTPDDSAKPKPRTAVRPGALHAAGVAALTLAAYANSFGGAFHFDDYWSIVDNPCVRTLECLSGWGMLSQRPVGLLTFIANERLHGLSPVGFHLVNFGVHLAAALLVYRLVGLLFRAPALASSALAAEAPRVALLASALFACHPVQTQAVTYIVQRFTSLSTLLCLAASVGYLEWRLRARPGRWAFYAASVGAAGLAPLTKEIAFTLPVLVLLLELLLFEGPWPRRLPGLVPFLGGSALFGATLVGGPRLAARVSAAGEQVEAVLGMTHADYLVTQVRVVATYLRLLVWPSGQNLFYDYPIFHSLLDAQVLLSALLLAIIAGSALWAYLKHRRAAPQARLVALGVAWFFVALSVESGAVLIVDVINEHRLYYPSVGAFLAAAALFFWARRAASERWAPAGPALLWLAAVAVAALGVATHLRNRVWKDDVTLWQDVTLKAPGMFAGHLQLGIAHLKQEQPAQAEVALKRAIALGPYDAGAWRALADAYSKQRQVDRSFHASATAAYLELRFPAAIARFRQALALNPARPESLYGLGLALSATGGGDEARGVLDEACRRGSAGACAAVRGEAKAVPEP